MIEQKEFPSRAEVARATAERALALKSEKARRRAFFDLLDATRELSDAARLAGLDASNAEAAIDDAEALLAAEEGLDLPPSQ